MEELGKFLVELIRLNQDTRNFRIVCPDELESNRLGAVLDVTSRHAATRSVCRRSSISSVATTALS